MPRICELTGKKTSFGNQKTSRGRAKYLGGVGKKTTGITARTFKVNIQRVRAVIDGKIVRIKVSTKAIKSGLIVKPSKRNWSPAIPAVVYAPPRFTINWLTDRVMADKNRQAQLGRTMHGQRAIGMLTRTLADNVFGTDVAYVRPKNHEMTSPDVREHVLHVTEPLEASALLGLIAEGAVRQVYVDRRDRTQEEVVAQAIQLHNDISRSYSLWEPVVVGPLSVADHELALSLAQQHIRVSVRPFDQFCEDEKKHAELMSRTRSNATPKPASRG